jgi:uncharacterized protein
VTRKEGAAVTRNEGAAATRKEGAAATRKEGAAAARIELATWKPRLPLPLLLPLGALICSVGAMAGVGGGLFAVPALYMLWGLPLRNSVATGLVLVAVNSGTATLAESLHDDAMLNWHVIGVLLIGTLTGAQVGFAVQKRIPARLMKQIFLVVLFAAGAKVCSEVFFPPVVPEVGAFEFGVAQIAVAVVAGFGGGVLAPMLGVGGGLLIVPGLLIGLPELGYGGVRACSMAAAAVTSARSAWMHMRDGRVEWRAAGWLAASALAGGVLGVQMFHVEGMEVVARIALTFMLWFVAWRFYRELRETPPPAAAEDRDAA